MGTYNVSLRTVNYVKKYEGFRLILSRQARWRYEFLYKFDIRFLYRRHSFMHSLLVLWNFHFQFYIFYRIFARTFYNVFWGNHEQIYKHNWKKFIWKKRIHNIYIFNNSTPLSCILYCNSLYGCRYIFPLYDSYFHYLFLYCYQSNNLIQNSRGKN